MIERRTVGLLLTIMAICALAVPPRTWAQNQSPRPLRVRVDSVLAANTGKGMDPQFSAGMAERLKALFEYTTYRLVLHQELETVCGRSVTFEMPGGRILQIAPRSIDNNMISLELVLFEGTRPLMTTDLRLLNHAVLMVGGPRYHQGMLITIISMGSSEHPSEHRTPPQAMPSPTPASPDARAIPLDTAPLPQH
jgi:hypothetical protein